MVNLLVSKGLKVFMVQRRVGHISVQPLDKTQQHFLSQLQFNNSIKLLARYHVSMATLTEWITDWRGEDTTSSWEEAGSEENPVKHTHTHTRANCTHTTNGGGASSSWPSSDLWPGGPTACSLRVYCLPLNQRPTSPGPCSVATGPL